MFNPIEELRNGEVKFLDNYLSRKYDRIGLISYIRNDKDKINLIKAFIYKIIDNYSSFCFDIIYDINEFNIETSYLLETYDLYYEIDQSKLFNILNHTNYGVDLVLRHSKMLDESMLKVVFSYILITKDNNLINKFKTIRNLHTRYLFMDYLVNYNYDLFKKIYPNVLEYLTNIVPCYKQMSMFEEKDNVKYMDMNDISSLAVHIKKNSYDEYVKIRNFILKNYEKNVLAEFLSLDDESNELEKNIDTYYKTTNNYYLTLFKKYENKINEQLTYKLRYLINLYGKEKYINQRILNSELLPLLYEWTIKYLDLSKSREYRFISSGSSANCYQIGDYVVKFINFKWSYEDIICPNLYLILKNEEEKYIRDNKGIVKLGLEVQKYLGKSASNVNSKVLDMWREELSKNGYILNDTLINGSSGTNAYLLDSYLDADTKNHKNLPDWFKENPLVLIDRDRVYKKGSIYKQQTLGY